MTNAKQSLFKENASPEILFEAQNLGVEYITGFRREDLQSYSYYLFNNDGKSENFWAIKNITMSGYAGDIIGILGKNGAGKTTLCKVIAGILKPDTGSVRINGTVSALFTLGTGFNFELSGIENIFLNGYMLGYNKETLEEKKLEIIKFSELGYFIYEPIKKYSSGMRARLGFSIAAMLNPDIMVIDEALSAGDNAFNKKAADKMKLIVEEAKLVFLVSHNLDLIEKYCNKVLWIEQGRIIDTGEPSHIIGEYKKEAERLIVEPIIELNRTRPTLRKTEVIYANEVSLNYNLQSKHHLENIETGSNNKNSFWALKNISFRIYEKEIVGIIGPNGAGKTTLCRILTGILKCDKGELVINGDTTALLSIGTGFNIQLTGKDNIYLNGLMMGIAKQKLMQLYKDIVDFSGINHYILQPVKHYSSGMNARLGFSIAAMLQPDIFIIDEVLSAGDAEFYKKASYRIQEMIKSAKAVIVVTHNLDFVEKVCTRAILIDQGQIMFDGNTEKAISKYLKKNNS